GDEANIKQLDATGYVAYRITSLSGAPGTVHTSVSLLQPSYALAAGAIVYSDICPTGTDLTPTDTDEGLTPFALPHEFSTFQLAPRTIPSRDIQISTNGFLAFDPTLSDPDGFNQPLPDGGQPNGIVAPYWEDLENVHICGKADAANHQITFQWTGNHFLDSTETVQMQVILHADTNVIELVYGANHTLAGNEPGFFTDRGATVGVENVANTRAYTVLYNQAVLAPSTSKVLTPQ